MNLPGMGFPGISHETAIFELGNHLEIQRNNDLEIPTRGIPDRNTDTLINLVI